MKRHDWIFLIVFSLSFCHQAVADDAQQIKPINSSFVGDDSNSVMNDSFIGEDLQKKTEKPFDGENTEIPINSYFAGDSTTKKEATETDAPFAEDNSKTAKDGIFIGQELGTRWMARLSVIAMVNRRANQYPAQVLKTLPLSGFFMASWKG